MTDEPKTRQEPEAAGSACSAGLGDPRQWESLAKQYRNERDKALSLLGALVCLQGGEARINDEHLMVGYTFESYRDEALRQTIIRANVDA